MIPRSSIPSKYLNKDLVISRVQSHDNLWVVEHPNGKFHTINSDGSYVVKRYPVEKILIP